MKALLLDFDDTLVPYDDAVTGVMHGICNEISGSSGVEPELVKATLLSHAESIFPSIPEARLAAEFFDGAIGFPTYAHELLWDDKSPFDNVAPQLSDFRVAEWSATCESLELDGQIEVGEMSRRLVAETAALRLPYPGTAGVLQDLAQRFRMAILTNGEPSVQAMKIERSGLGKHFNCVVHGAEHGSKPRPRPRPFEVVLEQIDCDPNEAAMIGDTLQTDIRGARDCGVYAIWINRTGRVNDTDVRPDAEVGSLDQLLELLNPTEA